MKSGLASGKLRRDGTPDLRFARRDERLARLEPLLKKPRTVDELADALGVTDRAIYFLFAALAERGRTVARIGPKAGGRYMLVGAGAA